jgi:phosphoribosylformimino-5-aminoimidazole carboxamide ribotide isomerase
MLVIPAIDIKGGKCVRLRQGCLDQATEYGNDPVAMAIQWASLGAHRLHIVDLDGAFSGGPVNKAIIEQICRSVSTIPIQVGGGIRTFQSIEDYIKMGVSQVVLGTSILEDPTLFKQVCGNFPGKIMAALDTKNGEVASKGWVETSGEKMEDVVSRMVSSGVKAIIFTDIQKDGMLSGPNIRSIKNLLKKTGVPIIASGGISTLADVEALLALDQRNLFGMIIGKALYDGLIELPFLLRFIRERANVIQTDNPLS